MRLVHDDGVLDVAQQPAEEQPHGVTAQQDGRWPPHIRNPALLGRNRPADVRGALVKGRC